VLEFERQWLWRLRRHETEREEGGVSVRNKMRCLSEKKKEASKRRRRRRCRREEEGRGTEGGGIEEKKEAFLII
jgi:hypothetical protein